MDCEVFNPSSFLGVEGSDLMTKRVAPGTRENPDLFFLLLSLFSESSVLLLSEEKEEGDRSPVDESIGGCLLVGDLDFPLNKNFLYAPSHIFFGE
jgi:hypothetical protein